MRIFELRVGALDERSVRSRRDMLGEVLGLFGRYVSKDELCLRLCELLKVVLSSKKECRSSDKVVGSELEATLRYDCRGAVGRKQ